MENIWGMGQVDHFFSITNGEMDIYRRLGWATFTYQRLGESTQKITVPPKSQNKDIFTLRKNSGENAFRYLSIMRSSCSTGFRQLVHGFLICPIICRSFVHHFSIICSSFSYHLFHHFLHHSPSLFHHCSHHYALFFSIILHHFSIIHSSFSIIFSITFPSFSITFPSSVHHFPSFSPSLFHHFTSFSHHFPIILHHFASFFHRFSIIFPWKNGAPGRLQDRGAAARSRERAAGAAFAAVAGAMAWGGVQRMGIFFMGIRCFFL